MILGRLVPQRYRHSLAHRVTMLTTMAVGLAVTVVAFAAYATVRMQSYQTLDDSLHNRAVQAAKGDDFPRSLPPALLGAADVKIMFLDSRTRTISDNSQIYPASTSTPEYAVAAGRRTWSARTIGIGGVDYRVVAVNDADADGEALILAQSLAPTERTLDRLGLVMLFFGLAGMIAAALAGWAVARNGLRPVRRLTAAVEHIARTERLDPIPVEGPYPSTDEVARLSIAFNAMLAALSASQDRQRRLVADAGHELRTPLTSLRTNLDLLAQDQDQAHSSLSPQTRHELLEDVRGQIAEMTTLIGDLVELAREDPPTPSEEPVELAAIVSQAVTRVRRRTTSAEIVVSTEPWWVTGDPGALERAITNLLDNAVKWSPPGGTVTVELRQGTVSVTDQGAGIAEADLPHVFERFYRSAESRTMPGSGLGLSIVKTVAERHGGSVRAGAAPGGGAALWFSVPGTMAPPEQAEVLVRS